MTRYYIAPVLGTGAAIAAGVTVALDGGPVPAVPLGALVVFSGCAVWWWWIALRRVRNRG